MGKRAHGRLLLVDPDDSLRLRRYRWWVTKKGYAARAVPVGRGVRPRVALAHNELLKPGRGYVVDHRNGDPLDNRRVNLRIVTEGQNRRNHGAHAGSTSEYVGVSLDRKSGLWRADVKHEGRQVCLGRFESEVEAASVRDRFVKEHYGGLGRLNFGGSVQAPSRVVELDVAPKRGRWGPAKGAGEPRKLSAQVYEVIRRRYADGEATQSALAGEYGVHQSHISRIVNHSPRIHG